MKKNTHKTKNRKAFGLECQARELNKYRPSSVSCGRFSDILMPPFLQSDGIYVTDLRRETVGLTGDLLQEYLTLKNVKVGAGRVTESPARC